MNTEEIAASYDQIADHWASDEFPASDGIEQHKRAIAFSAKTGNALDIGCGSSGRIVDLLLHSGFSVHGIDISSRMIELARTRGQAATFERADIGNWEFPLRYDFISAWDSIWHLDVDRQRKVTRKISEGLKEDGIFIFTTGAIDAPSEHTDSFLGQRLFYGALGIPNLLNLLQDCGLILRHLEYDQFPEKHLYLITQKSPDQPCHTTRTSAPR